MNLLIVEDDPTLGSGLRTAFNSAQFRAELVTCGAKADEVLQRHEYSCIILDLSLPRVDGIDLLKRLRGRGDRVPVLILTARDAVDDLVGGLEVGADDYLTKPFGLAELEARVRALIRRGRSVTRGEHVFGSARLVVESQELWVGEQIVKLADRECTLLERLAHDLGSVVTKSQLSNCLDRLELSPNAIEVYVHRLRKKLTGSGFEIKLIRGIGYMLCERRSE
ncbi:MAG: response regulator [Bdellovibrionota bacterium]